SLPWEGLVHWQKSLPDTPSIPVTVPLVREVSMSIQVLVLDDHAVVRGGLSSLFRGTDIQVVGEASDGNDAVAKTLQHKPDVVLMDIRMPEVDGLAALERIQVDAPGTPVVMFSTYDNPTYVARGVALGAVDYVLK